MSEKNDMQHMIVIKYGYGDGWTRIEPYTFNADMIMCMICKPFTIGKELYERAITEGIIEGCNKINQRYNETLKKQKLSSLTDEIRSAIITHNRDCRDFSMNSTLCKDGTRIFGFRVLLNQDEMITFVEMISDDDNQFIKACKEVTKFSRMQGIPRMSNNLPLKDDELVGEKGEIIEKIYKEDKKAMTDLKHFPHDVKPTPMFNICEAQRVHDHYANMRMMLIPLGEIDLKKYDTLHRIHCDNMLDYCHESGIGYCKGRDINPAINIIQIEKAAKDLLEVIKSSYTKAESLKDIDDINRAISMVTKTNEEFYNTILKIFGEEIKHGRVQDTL